MERYCSTDQSPQRAVAQTEEEEDQAKKNETGGACSMYRERRGAYVASMETPDGKRPLGRTRRRWEDTIKMDLQEVEFEACIGSSCLRIGTGGGHLRLP